MSGSYFRFKDKSGDWTPADEAAAGRWLVTYCSLAITLVSVFMMLVSYSSFAGGKVKKYRQSLGDSKGYVPVSATRMGDLIEPAMNDLKRSAEENGYSGKVEMLRIKNGFKAIMNSGIFFSSGSAKLKEDAHPFLNEITKIAKKSSFSIGVAGHTNGIATETAEYGSDWGLSVARATRIMKYFLDAGKMPAGRMAAAGFGSFRPISSANTAEGLQRNDRMEFLFVRDVLPD